MARWWPRLWLLIQMTLLVAWAVWMKPDFTRDWPAMLTGVAIWAFPLVVGGAWIWLRRGRIGRV